MAKLSLEHDLYNNPLLQKKNRTIGNAALPYAKSRFLTLFIASFIQLFTSPALVASAFSPSLCRVGRGNELFFPP